MSTIDEVEDLLGKARTISFNVAKDHDKEPTVVGLVFKTPEIASSSYNRLMSVIKDMESTMVFQKSGSTMNISIVQKETADAINLINLRYSTEEWEQFIREQPEDRAFVFLVYVDSPDGLVVVATKEPFSPLLVAGYKAVI